ncbi:MAG: ATP-dependent RecD-like DNA helicase [Lachnospiraceae bacterium]|nr:ATP-dependent RecD-like DNA helicase [Lachnospiraceae bacterium]
MTIEGYVEKIVYRNETNGYAVISVETDSDEETLCGYLHGVAEGSYIVAECEAHHHPKYDLQYRVSAFELKMPDDLLGVEKYLGSGVIKGIGEVMAKKIVKKFKLDTFRIIEEEPEKLAQIKGISLKKAQDIAVQFREKTELRDAMVFLAKYDLTPNLAVKIFEEYGNELYDIMKTNPYQLAEDVAGVGFKTADAIAMKSGIGVDSEFRCRAAIVYTLTQSAGLGHIYIPKDMLFRKVEDLLTPEQEYMGYNFTEYNALPEEVFLNQLDGLMIEHKVVIKELDGTEVVYDGHLYHMELDIARMLLELNITETLDDIALEAALRDVERAESLDLDEMQAQAVKTAAKTGLTIITGGPGTGKTTTIHTIIKYFEMSGAELLLAAPTGRAAKRITETSGYPAQTIHRLLEISGDVDREGGYRFERNQLNPLEADVVIVDEASMIDTYLMHALLKAVLPGTHLVLVGDENQLPSVGPGNILRDMIAADCFFVSRLTRIFRQEENSDIVVNAHKINRGEPLTLNKKSRDFFLLQRQGLQAVLDEICVLVKDNLPAYVQADAREIQVLTPMRKGELGVENLNPLLQNLLNPPDAAKQEKIAHGSVFREGDKVMQIKNDYNLEWNIYSDRGGFCKDSGTGVFNGDMGVITQINDYGQTVRVRFDDNKTVEYPYTSLDELELAYAITVHKSQGSEYPAVVMPVLSGPRVLFNRNLLYTAVTRARQCVVLVGSGAMVGQMIQNSESQKRYSSLDRRLKELAIT